MCSPAGGCGDMSGQSSLPHSTHIVSVKTGDKKGAGTDGNVGFGCSAGYSFDFKFDIWLVLLAKQISN